MTENAVNRRVLLAAYADGIPEPANFEISEVPVPAPGDGTFLVRNRFLSVDPAQRGYASAVANYADPVPLGSVMRAFALGEVVASRQPDYEVGEVVVGAFGWQDFAISDGGDVFFRVAPEIEPPSAALGVLGLSGVTAYFGLLDIGRPQSGETVVVSTAAGSVGSAVGQIAKIQGCRAVGITGGADKVGLCTDTYGYDAAVDYKAGALDAALGAACPDGIDVYFDNTGGTISDTVLGHLNIGGRIVVCGTAATANWDPPPTGPRIERQILVRRARMQGLIIFDYKDRFAEAQAQMAAWLKDGRLTYREEILDGIEEAPGAIRRLYDGRNMGKLMIRLDEAGAGI
jgi:NADPH-dependent curcumin reductase CurA